MAAGTQLPPRLVTYWTAGPGAADIGWNTTGDFARCRVAINAEVSKDGPPLPPRVIDGLCATLHKIATGGSPGHGSAE
jgi:hypothetical protein